jgi:hypothetical protein
MERWIDTNQYHYWQNIFRQKRIYHIYAYIYSYPSRSPEFIPGFLVGYVLLIFFCVCCPIMCLYVLSSVLWCPLRIPHKNDVRFVFVYRLLVGGRMSYLRYQCLFVCPTHNVLCCCFSMVMSNKTTTQHNMCWTSPY